MAITILHTADIHLDAPLRSLALRDAELREAIMAASRQAFSRLVDHALAEQVAALLIAGDLFDGRQRSARTGAFVTAEFDRLRRAGIRVFYIKGNHDAENPITGALDLPDNVHVFGARGGKAQLAEDVWVHGVSFARRAAPESLLPRFSAPVPGAVNIAMLHSSLSGAAGHDVYAPCSVAELKTMGFDYWALGHVHKRQVHSEAPWVVMPGMPQGRDIGEAGPKTASLLRIEAGRISVSEVPCSVVDFVAAQVDVSAVDSDDDLRATLRDGLSGMAAPDGGLRVLRLTLTGAPPRAWQILRDRDVWEAQLEEIARRKGGLRIDKLVLDLTLPGAPDGTAQESANATDALLDTMQALRAEPGFAAQAQAEVDSLLDALPQASRDRLAPDQAARDALAERLSEVGARRVLARMKGAEG